MAWAVLAAYILIGLGAYYSILGIYFLGDDFSFLDTVKATPSPGVIFSPLAERYFRPAVVFVYYVNYHISELSPWTYHLTLVLIHVANAWLVFLLGRSLAPARGLLMPALAGLLFLLFGGHTEAVSWTAGAADPLVTLFVLLALVLFLRSLQTAAPAPLLVGVWVSFAAALLSKELAVVLPVLIVLCGAFSRPQLPDSPVIRRTAIAVSVPVLLLIAYVVLRNVVLGFPFVTLAGLGTNSNLLMTTRAFVLRSFVPTGYVLQPIWDKHLDVWVIFPFVLLGAWRVTRTEYRPLVLLTLCFGVALAPILPLSISISTTESERLIYMATAFACLLTVWFIDAAVKQRGVVTAVVLIWCVAHVEALAHNNRIWQEAASLARGTLSTFAEVVREHGRIGHPVYVLNIVDDVHGAYVYRRGFHEALRLAAPDQVGVMAQTQVLSVYAVYDTSQPVRVVQRGPRTFTIDVGGGWLLGQPLAPTPTFTISEWSPRSFTVDFTEAAAGGLITYFTPMTTAVAGRVTP